MNQKYDSTLLQNSLPKKPIIVSQLGQHSDVIINYQDTNSACIVLSFDLMKAFDTVLLGGFLRKLSRWFWWMRAAPFFSFYIGFGWTRTMNDSEWSTVERKTGVADGNLFEIHLFFYQIARCVKTTNFKDCDGLNFISFPIRLNEMFLWTQLKL